MTLKEKKKILEELKKQKERLAELQQIKIFEESKTNYSRYLELVHQGQYKHARHTRLICEKLEQIHEGKLKRLAIFMPPRHSKSQSVTESFPSWYIGKDPNRRVIQVSYGDDLAYDFGFKNRQKVETFGKSLFGIDIDIDKQAKGDWAVKGRNGCMLSAGIRSAITGKGCNLLIIDDPVKNDEEAASETSREKLKEIYKGTLRTRLTPDGAIILIMTRWHEDDLGGWILKNEKDWDVINLPCEAEENDLLGREIGEPLWSEFGFNNNWVKETKKTLGSRVWNALYQQRPSSAQGGLLKRSWWKYYTELPQIPLTIMSVDATFKDKKTSDFVAISVWGKSGADMYLIDFLNERMDFPKTLKAILSIKEKHPKISQILIEDKANGSAIIQVLRTQIGGVIAVEPHGGKQARVNLVAPQVESGNVYLPSGTWFTDEFIEQCAAFPNGKHDDMVDSFSQAIARLMWQQAAIPQNKKKHDSFLYGEEPQPVFGGIITESYINYGGWS